MQTSETERLEALGAGAPGAPGFAALAEAQRRDGRPGEALELAEEGLRNRPDLIAGRIVRVRALLDLGHVAEAQAELGIVLDRVPDHPLGAGLGAEIGSADGSADSAESAAPAEAQAFAPIASDEVSSPSPSFADIAENELEAAFEEAEAQPEEMMDANSVAEATLRDVESEGPEPSLDRADSPFATETMAQLLEQQGHADKADSLRANIQDEAEDAVEAASSGESGGARSQGRTRVLGTLERWLANLRKDS